MSTVQVADQTFVAAPAAAVAALLGDRERWRAWFPDLTLAVREDRAEKGFRWTVSGALVGTMEVWLEPVLDGVVLHYFLHAEPAEPSEDGPSPAVLTHRRRVAGRDMAFWIKARFDRARSAGEPVPAAPESPGPTPPAPGTDPTVR